MKKDGVYRYSLQWAENTEEGIRAGELLEQLGNRKSAVVIAALNDYMDAHPEICNGTGKIRVKISGYDRKQLEEIIRSMLKAQEVGIETQEMNTHNTIDPSYGKNDSVSDDDITMMLENLQLFNEI